MGRSLKDEFVLGQCILADPFPYFPAFCSSNVCRHYGTVAPPFRSQPMIPPSTPLLVVPSLPLAQMHAAILTKQDECHAPPFAPLLTLAFFSVSPPLQPLPPTHPLFSVVCRHSEEAVRPHIPTFPTSLTLSSSGPPLPSPTPPGSDACRHSEEAGRPSRPTSPRSLMAHPPTPLSFPHVLLRCMPPS